MSNRFLLTLFLWVFPVATVSKGIVYFDAYSSAFLDVGHLLLPLNQSSTNIIIKSINVTGKSFSSNSLVPYLLTTYFVSTFPALSETLNYSPLIYLESSEDDEA